MSASVRVALMASVSVLALLGPATRRAVGIVPQLAPRSPPSAGIAGEAGCPSMAEPQRGTMRDVTTEVLRSCAPGAAPCETSAAGATAPTRGRPPGPRSAPSPESRVPSPESRVTLVETGRGPQAWAPRQRHFGVDSRRPRRGPASRAAPVAALHRVRGDRGPVVERTVGVARSQNWQAKGREAGTMLARDISPGPEDRPRDGERGVDSWVHER